MSEWRPIETAPKGAPDEQCGPAILVWCPDVGAPVAARFVAEFVRTSLVPERHTRTGRGVWEPLCGYGLEELSPTHWMPMLSPPG